MAPVSTRDPLSLDDRVEQDMGLGDWKDWKTRVYLLDRQKIGDEETATVLLTPQGVDMQKVGVVAFMELATGRAVQRTRYYHVQFEEHPAHAIQESGLVYYTLADHYKTAVIPFACHARQNQGPPPEKLRYPYRLMDEQFLRKILEIDSAADNALDEVRQIKARLNKLYREDSDGNRPWNDTVFRKLEDEMHSKHDAFVRLNRERYTPLKRMILERFGEKYPQTRKLRIDELNPEHRKLRQINRTIEAERSSEEQRSRKKWRDFLAPFRYAAASSDMLAHFTSICLDPNISAGELKERDALYDKLLQGDEKSKWGYQLDDDTRIYNIKRAREIYYHLIAGAVPIAALMGYIAEGWNSGSIAGFSVAGLGFLEWAVSRANQKNYGYPTSLIGTLRDTMGWTRYKKRGKEAAARTETP